MKYMPDPVIIRIVRPTILTNLYVKFHRPSCSSYSGLKGKHPVCRCFGSWLTTRVGTNSFLVFRFAGETPRMQHVHLPPEITVDIQAEVRLDAFLPSWRRLQIN